MLKFVALSQTTTAANQLSKLLTKSWHDDYFVANMLKSLQQAKLTGSGLMNYRQLFMT
jgi:hypothetical protein